MGLFYQSVLCFFIFICISFRSSKRQSPLEEETLSASEEDTLVGEFKELTSQVISRLALVILGSDTA